MPGPSPGIPFLGCCDGVVVPDYPDVKRVQVRLRNPQVFDPTYTLAQQMARISQELADYDMTTIPLGVQRFIEYRNLANPPIVSEAGIGRQPVHGCQSIIDPTTSVPTLWNAFGERMIMNRWVSNEVCRKVLEAGTEVCTYEIIGDAIDETCVANHVGADPFLNTTKVVRFYWYGIDPFGNPLTQDPCCPAPPP